MFCPKCGTQNADGSLNCLKCNANLQNPNSIVEQNNSAIVSSIVPVGRTSLAIAAGYLGLFSIIPFFAPISLIVSILALKQLKNNPGKLGKGRAIFGLIMGILGTIFLLWFILMSLINK